MIEANNVETSNESFYELKITKEEQQEFDNKEIDIMTEIHNYIQKDFWIHDPVILSKCKLSELTNYVFSLLEEYRYEEKG